MPVYPMDIAGLHRELPICKVTDDLYIGAFICFGDAELTVACARDMLAMLEADSYDYLFTAEAKSIPLIHEMARQSGAKKYFIARKGPKAYMPDPLHVEDKSITTAGVQKLYLGRDDADLIRGKRIVLMDDVISTGGSLHAMEELVKMAGGTVVDRIARAGRGRCGGPQGHQVPECPSGIQRRRKHQVKRSACGRFSFLLSLAKSLTAAICRTFFIACGDRLL